MEIADAVTTPVGVGRHPIDRHSPEENPQGDPPHQEDGRSMDPPPYLPTAPPILHPTTPKRQFLFYRMELSCQVHRPKRGLFPSRQMGYRIPLVRAGSFKSRSSALGIRPSTAEGWRKGDGTFPRPSSRPGAENRRPETKYGTGYPTPGTPYLIALLPYCPIALLPYCPIALLPYCLTA